MIKHLNALEAAISELGEAYETEWDGRRTRVDLDVIASALVTSLLPRLVEEAPSLEDALDALASRLRRKASKAKTSNDELAETWLAIADQVLGASSAAERLIEQCALWDYGMDDSVDEETMLEKLNAWRDTIHSALSRAVDAYKKDASP